MSQTETINNHAAFIWSVADLLRGDYKQSEPSARTGIDGACGPGATRPATADSEVFV